MSADIGQRIEHVINGLLPDTALQNQYAEPATLAERMVYYRTPGVSMAVINDGEIEWARGFGLRQWGSPEPVTEETLFQAGSISKPIFALAVMRLVEDGHLDLDEDVNAYLTSWKIPPTDSWQPKVTLRHLLSHSAGLTVHGFPGYLRHEEQPTIMQILNGEQPANTDPVRVNIIPGTQFRYSGGGTTVAQQLLVDVLGQPFPIIMRELVLDPLGMAHSTYEQPLPDNWAGLAATAHPWKYQPVRGRWHVYPEMAAAGLWTTPADLARAALAVQQAQPNDSNGFLSTDAITQMLTPQVEEHMGLGFFLKGKGDMLRFGHGGWDEGFVADVIAYQSQDKGAVIMVNSNQGYNLMFEVQRAIAKTYEWPEYFTEKKAAVGVPAERLAGYVGAYATKSGLQFKVTQEGDVLCLQAADQPPIALQPESETKFFVAFLNSAVSFEKAETGEVTRLILHQGEKQLSAEKQK
jgi:CubicO group peptidase (beta-lactamase class C family)